MAKIDGCAEEVRLHGMRIGGGDPPAVRIRGGGGGDPRGFVDLYGGAAAAGPRSYVGHLRDGRPTRHSEAIRIPSDTIPAAD